MKRALQPHAPFSAMREEDLDRIVRASTLAYHAPGETILGPATQRPAQCFVIRQGAVRGERPNAPAAGAGEALFELSAGEMFPLGALIARRGVTSVYRAAEDTFCLVFPVAVVDALLEASTVFQDFCTRRLAHLVDVSRAQLQASYAASLTGRRDFATPLAELLRQAPVVCTPDTALTDALQTMEDHRIGSLPVVDADARPLGVFTRQDVIGRVVLAQRPLHTPIRDVMSAPAITLPRDATAADAALLMTQRGIRHVLVADRDGRVAGVVSERDLFSLQRLSVRDLASAIGHAADVDALARCAADVRALSHALVAQGVAAGTLTRMIASLNDRVVARVLDLLAPAHDLAGVAVCWLGLGSEGRGEQTIATDQDNGLVFVAGDASAPVEAIRDRLLRFAREANHALDRCGYPLCKGGVMAMNPRWCASLDEWRAAFAGWIERGDPQSLLAAAIFFDFRPVWGNAGLAVTLRAEVAAQARANPRFLKQMSDNALSNRPPLNWRGELRGEAGAAGVEAIDLKLNGSVPFVDAARILALAGGVTTTGTVARLNEVGAALGIAAEEIAAWRDAFEFVQLLRLREQHRRAETDVAAAGGDNPNAAPLASLSELDRRILKEAMRQVRKIQQRLELDYPG